MGDKTFFGEALDDIADGPIGARDNLTEALMRRFAEKGLTLSALTDRRMMKRSRKTLEMYARRFNLAFPDYVPMKLRPKNEKAASKAKT